MYNNLFYGFWNTEFPASLLLNERTAARSPVVANTFRICYIILAGLFQTFGTT